jgi:hypothetical protein
MVPVIASTYNDINSFIGTLRVVLWCPQQPFPHIVTGEVIITYGFYDAGRGEFGLTDGDQCYATICPPANEH